VSAPPVSVLCAVHNGQRFLKGSIESILGQSFRDFELIVIDDGSTDGTAEILGDCAARDDRLVVRRQENTGLTAALNAGLELARGVYVARQDDDDLSMPERLAAQKSYLDGHPRCAVVGSRYVSIDEDGNVIGRSDVPLESKAIRRALVTHNVIAHSAAMFRTELVREIGGYDERFRSSQDYALWCALALRFDLANLKPCLLSRRLHPGQIGKAATASQLENRDIIRGEYRDAILQGRCTSASAGLKWLARLHRAVDRLRTS
jgi:glycosyltransferase involved in cell wall biosynthesis